MYNLWRLGQIERDKKGRGHESTKSQRSKANDALNVKGNVGSVREIYLLMVEDENMKLRSIK